jgi:hypothetical protein
MPRRPYTLTPVIHIDALYARVQQLCDALGLEWSPTHTPPVLTRRVEGNFKIEATTSRWSDGVITLVCCRELGDNRPVHHMSWIPWYVVTATLDGLPDGARIELEGGDEGATEMTRVYIDGASEAITETILAALGAQRPATS